MGRRASAIPRSVYPLLLLLVLAALWLWRTGADGPDGARPLFEIESGDIVSCAVRGPDAHAILTRAPEIPSGWRLEGDLADVAGSEEVATLLGTLATSLGSEAVAGADWAALPEDYGLDGRSLFEVRVVAADGRRRTLRVGARNPVTGRFYATGAGRDELFTVGEDLVGTLSALPDAVRARDLWTGFAAADADTVRLRFAGRESWDVAVRDAGGRWWLSRPDDGWARTGTVAARYHRRHADRRRTEAGIDWLRLRDRELDGLLSYLERDRVRDFLPHDLAAPQDGFAVRVSGAGGLAHGIVFGETESESRVRAWRDDSPGGLVMPAEVVRDGPGDLPRYLHTDVLTRGLAGADSFALARSDLGRVSFVPGPEGWRVSTAAAMEDSARLDLMGRDLAFYLDHLAIRRVLEPAEADPLGPPLTTLSVWATGPGVPPLTELRFGLGGDGTLPAVWGPADGRHLAVDRDILVSLQTVMMTAAGVRR